MAAKIPVRSEVPMKDRWDLSSLFESDDAWEKALPGFIALSKEGDGLRNAWDSADGGMTGAALLKTLNSYRDFLKADERFGYYAHLRSTEDEGDSASRGRFGRYMGAATAGQAAWAWLAPSIQALPEAFLQALLGDKDFSEHRVFLERLARAKPHLLSQNEERIVALQAEANQTARESFGVLTNVDMDFGLLQTKEGRKPLTQSTFASFLRDPDRAMREKAYKSFYREFDAHKNTIASLYSGSVKTDKYLAQVRNFPSAREAALFPDNVPTAVYDNLVSTVSENLPSLHEYYELRRRALKLDELRHYDVYVPLATEAASRHSYDEAVDIVTEALSPLGAEYVDSLRQGLLGGWVDKYENKGKRSGAFSAGSYAGKPYILLNYKEDVLRDIFTLAHEGGHSMHSWYSVRSNPFMCYSYTIFEAEVASTFNEHLVFECLLAKAGTKAEKAALLSNRIDDLLATLFRQTMFAEFEALTHAMAESGEDLTVDSLRNAYGTLLRKYFGPAVKFEALSDLEGLRIPHFYNAFYVYKYATGISASLALSEKVLREGAAAREGYFAFLRSGGSRFPLDSLKLAGVDMSSPEPVAAACATFAGYVTTLKDLLGL